MVCCDPNGDPIRGSHWDRIEATVRPELTRDGDNNAIACAVTLEEGQGDSELHRLVGGVLHRPILSLEVSLNFLG